MFKARTLFDPALHQQSCSELFKLISENYQVDEDRYLQELLPLIPCQPNHIDAITQQARKLVTAVRQGEKKSMLVGVEAFLQQYSLETQEGIILMCLAEALLRIPDPATADALIKDKLSTANWGNYLQGSDSFLVNASSWGLMLTGRLVSLDSTLEDQPNYLLARVINKLGEPVVRQALYSAMKIMSKQFVLGGNIQEALKHSRDSRALGYSHSYDMLGEAALICADAQKYFDHYAEAIKALSEQEYDLKQAPRPTISIKLSALHPRYEASQQTRVMTELYATVLRLIHLARSLKVGISIDAEEADRLELSLKLFEKLYRSQAAQGWGELGFVIQAYSKRALPVLIWLNALAKQQGDQIPVRLVKGAYWDSEIKWSQQTGQQNYPVFTRKAGTDVSYLACARFLLSEITDGQIYPQFATHNAQTVASILTMAAERDYEFQRLHGMGQALYDALLANNPSVKVRIYAPVGAHQDLLPYLVRRLLENGANTSFVHKLLDRNTPIERLIIHPVITLRAAPTLANHKIALPPELFKERLNSCGLNLNIEAQAQPLLTKLAHFHDKQWQAGALIGGETRHSGRAIEVRSPYNQHLVGQVYLAQSADIQEAIARAQAAFPLWRDTSVAKRSKAIELLSEKLEQNRAELISLCHREAGKNLQDGIDEVREAVDFCRFYAAHARKLMAEATTLPGPTGELNQWSLQGRGPFLCISPWNFPLAIFIGQVAAALVCGNTVIAKPAEQTNLVAYRAVQLAHEAGIPADVLQLLPGRGAEIGTELTQDERLVGVCFTGSTATAKTINRILANRDGAIAKFIAETGGQNAMIVDSSALPEQVIIDVIHSAFQSAGQRCSALRVLYVQEEIAERIIELLKGAMMELNLGDPARYQTDIGPVIDANAQKKLLAHIDKISKSGKLIAQTQLPADCQQGYFVPPTAIEITHINQLSEEQFGPVLHVIRYQAAKLQHVIDDINSTGFGLTLGIHSRNSSQALRIAEEINVGNAYINRNQIGAVVGVQPFGGQGLSGTGPKAGGHHYLLSFMAEKTISHNVTAIGGNATLLSLADD